MAASEEQNNETTSKEEDATTKDDKKLHSAVEFEPPLACVRRILKHSLPSSTNVGKDASAAFARACGIFIIYITACANDFAREHKRQTITANDVLAAVQELDFESFIPEMSSFLESYRKTEKKKKDAKAAAKKVKEGEKGNDDDDDDDEDEDDSEMEDDDGDEEGDENDSKPTPDSRKRQDDDDDDDENDKRKSPLSPKKRKLTEDDDKSEPTSNVSIDGAEVEPTESAAMSEGEES